MLELSQVAKIKVLELTMRELYSSRIKSFSVFGRLNAGSKDVGEFPEALHTPQWQSLGNFTAENHKGTQQFPLQSAGWVKFLGFEFLSHHGAESACTINEIGAYGIAPEKELEGFDVQIGDVEQQQAHTHSDNGAVSEGNDAVDELVDRPGASLENASDMLEVEGEASIGSVMQEAPNATQGLGQVTGSSPPVRESFLAAESSEREKGHQKPEAVPLVTGRIAKRPLVGGHMPIYGQDAGAGLVPVDEHPAVTAFRRLRLELQVLKRNNSMLANYVDVLRSGLMDTIDELWNAITREENRSANLSKDVDQINASVQLLQTKLERLESAVVYNAELQLKTIVGTVGIGFGMLCLLLSWHNQSGLSLFLIGVLSAANMAVGLLNFFALTRPLSA